MNARNNREYLTLAALFLAANLLWFLGSVSFGATPEDIHRWKKTRDIETLVMALGDEDAEIRVAAAGELANVGDRRAIAPLITALGDGISTVREAAARALENLGEPLGGLVVQSLKGSEKAREALAAGKDPRAIAPIIKALGAWDPNVCVAAAQTLGKIGDPRAVEPLIKALKEGTESVQEAAAWALEKIGDRRALDPLIKALEQGNPNVRAAAAWAIGKSGDQRALDPLIKAQYDLDPSVREAATWSIGRLGDKKAVAPLIRSLGNKYYKVRIAAAWSLGKLGDRQALDPLIEALGDKYPEVRKGAAWSLGKLGDRRAVDPLIRALGDKNPEVREALSVSLEELGETVGKQLQESLKGSNEAMEELSSRKDPRCLDVLIAVLENEDGQVRRAAATTLGRIRDPGAVDGLVAMAGRWNLRDRAVATRALMNIDQKDAPGRLAVVFRVMTRPASLVYLLCTVCLLILGAFVAVRIRGRRRRSVSSSP